MKSEAAGKSLNQPIRTALLAPYEVALGEKVRMFGWYPRSERVAETSDANGLRSSRVATVTCVPRVREARASRVALAASGALQSPAASVSCVYGQKGR